MNPRPHVVCALDAGAWRLPLAFLASLALWAAALLGLEHAMRPPPSAAPVPRPLAVQLVEIAPAIEHNRAAAAAPEPPANPPQPPKSDPAPQAPADTAPLQDTPPRPEPAPRRQRPIPAKRPVQSRQTAAAPPAAMPSTPAAAPAAVPEDRGIARDGPARPLAQPLPVLPDDMRERNLQAVALARFLIHADGSVQVALIKPTPNPRLNLMLLEALKKWRFVPAVKNGKATESSQDIRVHFNVD